MKPKQVRVASVGLGRIVTTPIRVATCAHCAAYGPVTREQHEGHLVNTCWGCAHGTVKIVGLRGDR